MGMVAKTDDEIYVLSTIKIYSHFSFVFSAVSKKVKLLKILKVTKLLPRYENCREEDNKFIIFSLAMLALKNFMKF